MCKVRFHEIRSLLKTVLYYKAQAVYAYNKFNFIAWNDEMYVYRASKQLSHIFEILEKI